MYVLVYMYHLYIYIVICVWSLMRSLVRFARQFHHLGLQTPGLLGVDHRQNQSYIIYEYVHICLCICCIAKYICMYIYVYTSIRMTMIAYPPLAYVLLLILRNIFPIT